jgi:hypothetical protein
MVFNNPANSRVVFLVALALLPLACSSPDVQKRRHLERGNQYAAEKRDQFAVVEYANAVRLDPKRYTVDFENDRVRIVRLGFAGHERGLMVSHPPRVLVTLTDVAVKLEFQDGRSDERGALFGRQVRAEIAGAPQIPAKIVAAALLLAIAEFAQLGALDRKGRTLSVKIQP